MLFVVLIKIMTNDFRPSSIKITAGDSYPHRHRRRLTKLPLTRSNISPAPPKANPMKVEFVSILDNDHLLSSTDRGCTNNSSSSSSSLHEIPFHRSSTTNTSDGLVLPTLKASWTTPSVHLSLRSCSNATTRRSSVAKKVGDSRTPHSCRWFVGVAVA